MQTIIAFIIKLFNISDTDKRDWSKEIRTRARVTNSRALTPTGSLQYRSIPDPS